MHHVVLYHRPTHKLFLEGGGLEPKMANADTHRGDREVYFAELGCVDTAMYNRHALTPDETITGPAILEESGSTSILPPGTAAEISDIGSVIISL